MGPIQKLHGLKLVLIIPNPNIFTYTVKSIYPPLPPLFSVSILLSLFPLVRWRWWWNRHWIGFGMLSGNGGGGLLVLVAATMILFVVGRRCDDFVGVWTVIVVL